MTNFTTISQKMNQDTILVENLFWKFYQSPVTVEQPKRFVVIKTATKPKIVTMSARHYIKGVQFTPTVELRVHYKELTGRDAPPALIGYKLAEEICNIRTVRMAKVLAKDIVNPIGVDCITEILKFHDFGYEKENIHQLRSKYVDDTMKIGSFHQVGMYQKYFNDNVRASVSELTDLNFQGRPALENRSERLDRTRFMDMYNTVYKGEKALRGEFSRDLSNRRFVIMTDTMDILCISDQIGWLRALRYNTGFTTHAPYTKMTKPEKFEYLDNIMRQVLRDINRHRKFTKYTGTGDLGSSGMNADEYIKIARAIGGVRIIQQLVDAFESMESRLQGMNKYPSLKKLSKYSCIRETFTGGDYYQFIGRMWAIIKAHPGRNDSNRTPSDMNDSILYFLSAMEIFASTDGH